MFGAVLEALVEPSRRLGVPTLPRRILDLAVPQRVGGRRAWVSEGRAVIEVHLDGADGERVRRVEQALEACPGVEWARVNGPLGRVIAALGSGSPPLAELVDLVERADAATGHRVGPDLPLDRGPEQRALAALVADGLGLALTGIGRVTGLGAVPLELASAVTAVDTVPRLRALAERLLDRPAADMTIAVANAGAQGLAQGVLGLALDAAYRVLSLREANANATAWRQRQNRYLATPARAAAAPVAVRRPTPLPPGPIEQWGDLAGLLGAVTFPVALAATHDPRQAAGLALASLPKSARLGREGFATWLGYSLARRGSVVLEPAALRRLDRTSTVVLDSAVLLTGAHLLGTVLALPGARADEVTRRIYGMFHGEDPWVVRQDGAWRLGPVDELAPSDQLAPLDEAGVASRQAARERQRLEAEAGVVVLGLTENGRLVGLAAVVPEPTESWEALAAACHRAGRSLVVAGPPLSTWSSVAGAVMPGGADLLATVRALQRDGGVLLVSRDGRALANADIGVGVDTEDGGAPWGAHVLVGGDLGHVALLIDASAVAAAVSRRSVTLAQAATGIGGLAVTASALRPPTPRALLAVNMAAAAALAHGAWAAHQLTRRPLVPPVSKVPWHAMPVDLVLDRVGTQPSGLDMPEARRRSRGGDGEAVGPTSLLSAVAEELSNPLTPILAAGTALSAAVGSVVDAGLVAGAALASALVGGLQRRGTDRALADLLAQSAVTARVRRDGAVVALPADQLVPGDILLLAPGDVVPADCRVVEAADLELDESSLTGEPFPVVKSTAPSSAAALAERTSMVYEGTTVAAGRGVVAVVATGTSTESGRTIAATRAGAGAGGVEARLAQITRVTVPLTLSSAVAVVGAGLLRGRSIASTAGAAVSLAVAAVPEGLPFLVSAAQLAAARRLSGLGALVRNPRTIEALGRADVLCFDKTGTLTEGRIALGAVAGPDGPPVSPDRLTATLRPVLAAGLRATPEPGPGQHLAHLTDRAVAEGAALADVSRKSGLGTWHRAAALPFEPSRGFHATLGRAGQVEVLSVKGAPEIVLPRCAAVARDGRRLPLDRRERRRLTRQVEQLAALGYRVLAVAERVDEAWPTTVVDDDVRDLTLLGYLALTDPVRTAARASITTLRDAGVQIVMITGDHPSTAASIARRLDLLDGRVVVTGPELDSLTDEALARRLPDVAVVARSTPTHKVRVVQAFQQLGRTVAMPGDGANDAPAIRLADVGIALGRRSTPAARAAADLVVTDDRLETIIAALVEGRAMWGSVRKALGILVGGNLGEVAFTVLGALATGASPLNARQLLLVNLLTDLAPALAVALRPPQAASVDTLLTEGPEASLGAPLVRDVSIRAAGTTLAATTAALLARATGNAAGAETISLVALVAAQLGQTLVAGGPSRGVLLAGLGSVAVLGLVVQAPVLSAFFGSTPLGLGGLAIAALAAGGATALSSGPQLSRFAALSAPLAREIGIAPVRSLPPAPARAAA
ncbi:MAG: HAD-IC family P-type ATPase [Actinomycetes bacterium]